MLVEANKEYSLPVFVSKEITVSGYFSYSIQGELTNDTDNDVIIECLDIALAGRKGNTTYESKLRLKNIVVAANSTYQISSSGHQFRTEHGGSVPTGVLDYARISNCVINGESVKLKKLEGDRFIDQDEQPNGAAVAIVGGSIGLLCAIAIIIYKWKTRFE